MIDIFKIENVRGIKKEVNYVFDIFEVMYKNIAFILEKRTSHSICNNIFLKIYFL
jgi:hypothetical protein